MYDINRLPNIIDIGYTGEEKFRTIQIDMSAWMPIIPHGEAYIVHIRPGETRRDAYIADTTFQDNILTWEIKATDLGSVEGIGKMEVWLERKYGNILQRRGKSAVAATLVHGAINDAADTDPPARTMLLNLIAKALTLPPGSSATAQWEHEGYYGDYTLTLGIPKGEKGDKGDQGDPAPLGMVVPEVDRYLQENFSNPSNPPLDRSLRSSLSAAPADIVGEINNIARAALNGSRTEDSDADLYIADPDGNALAMFSGGHLKVKNFDSSELPRISDMEDAIALVGAVVKSVNNEEPDSNGNVTLNVIKAEESDAYTVDLDIADSNGNVIARFQNGHIKTKNFDSGNFTGVVKSVNHEEPDEDGNVDVVPDPEMIETAVYDYLESHPIVESRTGIVSVADYHAVGDGETDDSAAIQQAIDENYDVYFESDKTYYLASAININHNVRLHGGKNTFIKTKTPEGGIVNDGFCVTGTLKKTTTITSNYTSVGNTDNSGNKLTLASMDGVEIGDLIEIQATDQYYSYARQYYYLGGVFVISDIDNGHVFIPDVMPWDINKTNNVTVKVYSAPTAIIENLNFISDTDNPGHYRYCVRIEYSKNCVVRNCEFSHMDNGVQFTKCFNCKAEYLTLSQTDPDLTNDRYGVSVSSCTNTTIDSVVGICANSCLDLTGQFPNLNTKVLRCNLYSEARAGGMGMHENAYNTLVEDCILGGLIGYGTMVVNRCRFVGNNRVNESGTAMSYRGNYKPEWSTLLMSNCEITGDLPIYLDKTRPQRPIHAYDNIIGRIEIVNCVGGKITYVPVPDETNLSIRIKQMVLRNWRSCYEIYHDDKGSGIDELIVDNCTFDFPLWLNNHNNVFANFNISYIHLMTDFPKQDRIFVNLQKGGGEYFLPAGVPITFSSDDENARFMVFGKNLASDDPDDYSCGSIVGAVNGNISRNIDDAYAEAVTESGGDLTFETATTGNKSMYLKGFVYVGEASMASMSCKLKNVGETNPSSFRLSICVMDADTMKVSSHGQASAVQATSEGADASFTRGIPANSLVQFYIQCSTSVLGAETTFENLMISVTPREMSIPEYTAFDGSSRGGDGTLTSLKGKNRVIASPSTFSATFSLDNLEV